MNNQLRNEELTYCAVGIQMSLKLYTIKIFVKSSTSHRQMKYQIRSVWRSISSAREKRDIMKEVQKTPKVSSLQLAKDLLMLRITFLVCRL